MTKWNRLLDVYSEIEEDSYWDHLRQPGIRLVTGDGPDTAETARVMVIGEAPGATENGSGRPFCGASGRVLTDLLALAGLSRQQCFITNVVKYRPPGNRTPSISETYHGQSEIRREFGIIRPTLVIAVGRVAFDAVHPMRGICGLSAALRSGVVWPYGKIGEPRRWVSGMLHPAYGLRNPKARPEMESHWEQLGAFILEEGILS